MERLKDLSLSEQFEHTEILDLPEGVIEIIDLLPEKLKTRIPVVLAPGWTATPNVYRENLLSLAGRNRRVLSFRAPHGIETREKDLPADVPDAELRKVAALVKVLEKKGIPQADIVGHSEGGIYATLAFSLYPEKFRNLVLVNPAGIIGPDTVRRLVVEFSRGVILQLIQGVHDSARRKSMLRAFGESARSVAEGPVHTIKEVLAISQADIRSMLRAVKQKGKGISIIHAADDKTFPVDRAQEALGGPDGDGLIDNFYVVKGSHNILYLEPEEYSHLIDIALDALENKTEKKSAYRAVRRWVYGIWQTVKKKLGLLTQ